MNATDPSRLNCILQPSEGNCTLCKIRYTGEFCEADVLDDPVVFALVVVGQVISEGSSLFFLVWTIYALFMRICKLGFETVSLVHGCGIMLILSLFFRMANEIDIYTIYLLYKPITVYILGSSYLIFIMTSSMLTLSVWLNVVSSLKKLKIKQNLQGPYLGSIIISLISTVIFIGLLIFAVITDLWNIAVVIQILVLVIIYLGIIITMIYYLPIFREASKNVTGETKKKLEQVNRLVLWFFIIFIITLITFIFGIAISGLVPTNNPAHIYIYLIQETLSRIFITPTIYILILLLLFGWITDLKVQSSSTDSKTKTNVTAVQ